MKTPIWLRKRRIRKLRAKRAGVSCNCVRFVDVPMVGFNSAPCLIHRPGGYSDQEAEIADPR